MSAKANMLKHLNSSKLILSAMKYLFNLPKLNPSKTISNRYSFPPCILPLFLSVPFISSVIPVFSSSFTSTSILNYKSFHLNLLYKWKARNRKLRVTFACKSKLLGPIWWHKGANLEMSSWYKIFSLYVCLLSFKLTFL